MDSSFKRYTGKEWAGHFVKKEFLNKPVLKSFEISFQLLLKKLALGHSINSLPIESKIFKSTLQTSLDKLKSQNFTLNHTSLDSKSLCHLNNLFIYETFITKFHTRNSDNSLEFNEFSFLSGSSIKRKLVIRKNQMLSSLIGLRRVVRVHCLIDTNMKLRFEGPNGQVIGSSDLDSSRSE